MTITDPQRLLSIGTPKDCYSACCFDPLGWNAAALRRIHWPNIKCAGHLDRGLNPVTRKETLYIITEILRHYEFDAIAFRGLSGALFAPSVALALDKTLLAVRKGERNHSSRNVEGDYAARRYVMLDDMVSSGATVYAMYTEIKDVMPHAQCIGLLQYLWLNRASIMHHDRCVVPIDQYVSNISDKYYDWKVL